MRLVLAHDHDITARELAARWGSDAVLLTPAELSSEDLLLHLDEHGAAQAEVTSRPEVTSVLSRLGGISAADLPQVNAQDAVYAAAELDAFLRAWLGVWPGPVINRPSTTCLNGPGWRPEQWVVAATAVGLRARPIRRRATLTDVPDLNGGTSADATRVTVVGGNWFGTVSEEIGHRLCTLAEAVGCSTLEAVLVDDVITQMSAWPDLATPGVADALASLLDGTP
jgi:DNA-directed RNA polymerase subunit H (RpoH/RPB5)